VLANIYLHYALDLWFEKRYVRTCKGGAYMVRYADDYVACFTSEADARRFMDAMAERLAVVGWKSNRVKPACYALATGQRLTAVKRV